MKLSKKIGSALLAGVMSLSLAVPAFAANETVKVESSITLPTINVVMPTSAAIVMNPYKMSVNIDPKDKTKTASDQIVSQEMYVKNMSNLDLQVSVQIQGTHGKGDAKFATSTTTGATPSTVKEAYIYAKFAVGTPEAKITDPGTSTGTGIVLLGEGATPGTDEVQKYVTGFGDPSAATSPEAAVYGTNVLRGTKLDSDNKQAVHPDEGTLAIKFFGDISPVTTWTDKDTLAATMAFKFTPIANDPATLSLDKTSGTLASTGTTSDIVTATFGAGNTEASVTSYTWDTSDANVATVTPDGTDPFKATVAYVGAGSATITVTAALDNGTSLTATYAATCN